MRSPPACPRAPRTRSSPARPPTASRPPRSTPTSASAECWPTPTPGCRLGWNLVAAIGRVESNHGRYGGNALNAEGVSTPGIYGIPLDGSQRHRPDHRHRRRAVDNDPVLDRAVGPMQFIPSTWSEIGVDSDSDGKRNPQDIDDAALATGVYLCSGGERPLHDRRPARGGLPLQPQQRVRRPGAVDHGGLRRRRLRRGPQRLAPRRRPSPRPTTDAVFTPATRGAKQPRNGAGGKAGGAGGGDGKAQGNGGASGSGATEAAGARPTARAASGGGTPAPAPAPAPDRWRRRGRSPSP